MAVAAKDAESPGMDKAGLKKSLTIAKRVPMHCALALGGDGKPIIIIDKVKKGPGLDRDIKEKAKDAKNHRWGMVEIDRENRKRAIFTINKAGGGGLARKMIVALKGTGFNKVIIKLEDGTIEESEEGEEEEMENEEEENEDSDSDSAEASGQTRNPEVLSDDQQQAPQMDASSGQATQDTQAEQAPAADTTQASADQQPPTGDQPADVAQSNNGLDAATLTKELTGLVKQMIQAISADPTKKQTLAQLAIDAQTSLKQNDLQGASSAMDILRNAMSDNSGQSPDGSAQPAGTNGSEQPDTTNGSTQPDSGDGQYQSDAEMSTQSDQTDTSQSGEAEDEQADHSAAPAITKARTAWSATRQKVEGDLGKLHNAFGSAFKGHDQEQEIGKAFRERVETVLNALDEELSQTLESVNRARTRRERMEMVERAHAILARHRAHVEQDKTIAALDTNPFIQLSIGKTMSTTIEALSRSIR